jgi:hypothetical protein
VVQGTPVEDLGQRLEQSKKTKELHRHFPWAVALYKNQLEDYYWYQDRREIAVVDALHLLNERYRRMQR